MADPITIKERRHQAQDRLMAACEELARSEGVAPPVKPVRLTNDAHFMAMQDLECAARFIESVNESIASRQATDNELQAANSGKQSRKAVTSTR